MGSGVRGPVVGIHVRPLPSRWELSHHYLRGEGVDAADMLFQFFPQWWRRNFIERGVVVIS